MSTSFDRGQVDRNSLEATERLRQRLAQERSREPGRRRPPMLPLIVVAIGAMALAGLAASGWIERRIAPQLASASAPAPPSSAEVLALRKRLEMLEARREEKTPPPNERLARTEAKVETSSDQLAREVERIDRLTSDLATLTARIEADSARDAAATALVIGAADRAEAMLSVMLARRAIEEGRPLGAVEAPLRRAFEARYPGAVAAVAALGAAPVSIVRLQRDLTTLATLDTDVGGGGQGWWEVFSRKVSRLVRPADETLGPAPRPAALAALSRGDVAEAAAQLRRLPQPRPAEVNRWLASADRLAAGEAALRQLEKAALLPLPAETDTRISPAASPGPA